MSLRSTPAANHAPAVAVLVPCFNEAAAVERVVRDFRAALPGATVYVYDNNSEDGTDHAARRAGARVRHVSRRGKGNVVRRMFADIEADVYVLVDGDGTYHAPSAGEMVRLLLDRQLDMVVGCRQASQAQAYRRGHRFGNRLLTGCVCFLFGREFSDILSGYRVFSRRFVKSFPALASGFETETELTVHALELRMGVAEVPTPYGARPVGSASKLSTYRDGWRILRTILRLYRVERALQFYSLIGAALLAFSVGLAIPVLFTYFETGLVPRLPTAVLSTGIALLAALAFVTGLVLENVSRGRQELRRLAYLGFPAPGTAAAARGEAGGWRVPERPAVARFPRRAGAPLR
jgi:glycosyltransferase involved in cell wall biosynthesis